MTNIIRVLVVDDSAYIRKVVREMLSQNPFIEVVGTARNGVEALELVETLQPDVITTDLVMPELDGVGFVREQMSRRPVPIVVMSSLSDDGHEVLSALEAGAVDFIQKPTAMATEKVLEVRGRLVEAVKAASGSRPEKLLSQRSEGGTIRPKTSAEVRGNPVFDLIVIGISTGGPQALRYLIPQLPSGFPVPIAIVMHMPVGYTALYAEKLNSISELQVREAVGGEELMPGSAFLAAAGKHMVFKRLANGSVSILSQHRPYDTPHRPSVDVMFESAADVYGARVLGIVMTGMGVDGRVGSSFIKARGGKVFAESEESCIVFGMPGAVVEAGLVDRVVSLDEMARVVMEAV